MDFDYFEFEGSLVEDLFDHLDPKLADLKSGIDPDSPEESWGFESKEHICGIAAVAAQQLMSSTCAWFEVDRDEAILLGPKVGKTSKMSAIHAAANFWKHSDGNQTPPHKRTKATLEEVGIDFDPASGDQTTYLVGNVFYRCGYDSLAAITTDLREWMNLVIELARKPKAEQDEALKP